MSVIDPADAVVMRGVTRRFGPVVANDRADLRVRSAEVEREHAVCDARIEAHVCHRQCRAGDFDRRFDAASPCGQPRDALCTTHLGRVQRLLQRSWIA